MVELWYQPLVHGMAGVALRRVLQVTWIRVVRCLPVAVQALELRLVLVVEFHVPVGLDMAQLAIIGEAHLVCILDELLMTETALRLQGGRPVAFCTPDRCVQAVEGDVPVRMLW